MENDLDPQENPDAVRAAGIDSLSDAAVLEGLARIDEQLSKRAKRLAAEKQRDNDRRAPH